MEPILIYLFKMLLCSALFYGYYRLILFNRNFHQWNRFYLMASMLLAVIIPFIEIPLFLPPQQAAIGQVLVDLRGHGVAAATSPATVLPARSIVFGLAALISLLLFIRMLTGMVKLFYYYRSSKTRELNPQVSVILTNLKNAPFSFFHWLFWREDIDPGSDAGQRILAHELTHIEEQHSIDKLITELLLCIFWINPFFWLIRRELAAVHEFIADRKAIASSDGAAFAEMILQAMQVQPIRTPGIVSPFFSSQIKRRLLMITSSCEPRFSYLRRISSLVLLFIALFSLALTIRPATARATAAVNISAFSDTLEITADSIFIHDELNSSRTDAVLRVDLASPYKPTKADLRQAVNDSIPPLYIVDGREMSKEELDRIDPNSIVTINVTKNEEAVSHYGKRGRGGVIYIVTKNGQVQAPDEPTEIREVVVVGYKVSKDSASRPVKEIEVIGKEMPATKTITLRGKAANSDQELTSVGEQDEVKLHFRKTKSENTPLFYVDGKKTDYDAINTIVPNNIESIHVLKGESAIAKYGPEGENGVVEITLKKK